jgi:MFS family permease
LSGVGLLGAGVYGLTAVTAPWQIYAANAVMASGWAMTSGTAITATIALWFDRRRGLAISLALNGASVGGFTVAPALVYLTHRQGVDSAVIEVIAAVLVVLVPAVCFGLRRPPTAAARAAVPVSADMVMPMDRRTPLATRRDALRSRHFWSAAVPFALAITAQVGFIVHQVAYLLPTLGPDGTGLAVGSTAAAAVVGRLALGTVIDRLDVRLVSAVSFASQAAALLAMIGLGWSPAALFIGSVVFGLSVGNVITLPALVVQREFAAASFGLVIGLSFAVGQFAFGFGPALLGLARDLAGSYAPALGISIALEIAAAIVVLRGRPRTARAAPSP